MAPLVQHRRNGLGHGTPFPRHAAEWIHSKCALGVMLMPAAISADTRRSTVSRLG
jgi:hypothetical protein